MERWRGRGRGRGRVSGLNPPKESHNRCPGPLSAAPSVGSQPLRVRRGRGIFKEVQYRRVTTRVCNGIIWFIEVLTGTHLPPCLLSHVGACGGFKRKTFDLEGVMKRGQTLNPKPGVSRQCISSRPLCGNLEGRRCRALRSLLPHPCVGLGFRV